jgi:hypothetical protein
MPSFRAKPVVITAERLIKPLIIQTLEGDMQGNIGDWLIKGTNGEFYPCKDDIFRKKYEPIDKDGVHALTATGPGEEYDGPATISFPVRNAVELK